MVVFLFFLRSGATATYLLIAGGTTDYCVDLLHWGRFQAANHCAYRLVHCHINLLQLLTLPNYFWLAMCLLIFKMEKKHICLGGVSFEVVILVVDC